MNVKLSGDNLGTLLIRLRYNTTNRRPCVLRETRSTAGRRPALPSARLSPGFGQLTVEIVEDINHEDTKDVRLAPRRKGAEEDRRAY